MLRIAIAQNRRYADAPSSGVRPDAPTNDTVALSDTDRRRFLLATTLTLLALPALWWANESTDSRAPSIAAAGVEVGDTPADSDGPTGSDPAADPGDPVFLNGPSAETAAVAEIAVPARPLLEAVTRSATYRNAMPTTSTCLVTGVSDGQTVTVVNLANNRSVTCVTALAPLDDPDQLVLHSSAFEQLADVTDAPIHVEIRR